MEGDLWSSGSAELTGHGILKRPSQKHLDLSLKPLAPVDTDNGPAWYHVQLLTQEGGGVTWASDASLSLPQEAQGGGEGPHKGQAQGAGPVTPSQPCPMFWAGLCPGDVAGQCSGGSCRSRPPAAPASVTGEAPATQYPTITPPAQI